MTSSSSMKIAAVFCATLTLVACKKDDDKGKDMSPDLLGADMTNLPDLAPPRDLTGADLTAGDFAAPDDLTGADLFEVLPDLEGADLTAPPPDMTEVPDLRMIPDLVGSDMTPPPENPPVLTGTLYWVEGPEGDDGNEYSIHRKDLPSEVPVTVLGGIVSTDGFDVAISARGNAVVFLVDGGFHLIANANLAVDGTIDPDVSDVFTCPDYVDGSSGAICTTPLLGNGVLVYKRFEFDGSSGDLTSNDFYQVALMGTQTATVVTGLGGIEYDTLGVQISDDGTKILHNQYPQNLSDPTPKITIATIGGGVVTSDYSVNDDQRVGFHQGTTNEVLRYIDPPFSTGEPTFISRQTFALTSNGADYGLSGVPVLQIRARNGSAIIINASSATVQAFNLSSVFPGMTPVDLADVAPTGMFEWVP